MTTSTAVTATWAHRRERARIWGKIRKQRRAEVAQRELRILVASERAFASFERALAEETP